MKRVFVCSPLRGADGQPSPDNVGLARRLMKAVFDAGHAPFTPHLLYPQVLSESAKDLELSFSANYKFLIACDEMWVYAVDLAGCSRGMRLEVEWLENRRHEMGRYLVRTAVVFMPPAFERVRDGLVAEAGNTTHVGTCVKCNTFNGLNRAGECLKCFADGTPARATT